MNNSLEARTLEAIRKLPSHTLPSGSFSRFWQGYVRALACGLMASLFLCLPAHASRIAFVAGMDQYRQVKPLRNAAADAQTMADTLRGLGYEVVHTANRDQRGFKDDLRRFVRRVQPGDEVVVFYSGHGVQIDGRNYLLPIDVRAVEASQVRDDAVALSDLLGELRRAKPRLTVAIIDACRDNPFESSGKAIGGRGLAGEPPATGELVMFAAGEGQQALDRLGNSDPVRNGVFTRVLVREMQKPGVSVDQVLRNTRKEVVRLAKTVGHEQVPALYDQVVGDFYFQPPGGSVGTQVARVVPEPSPAQPAASAAAPAVAASSTSSGSNASLIEGRYQVLGDGSEVKDTTTGLIWQRCSVGQSWTGNTCSSEAQKFSFAQAQEQALSGWRVPSVRELHSIVLCSSGKTKGRDDPKDGGGALANHCDGDYQRPTNSLPAFPGTPASFYWTSSPYVGVANSAWGVYFGYGYAYGLNRNYPNAVRLVRASP